MKKKHLLALILIIFIAISGCFGEQPPAEEDGECPVTCNDNNPCTIDTCDETTNFECQNTPTDGPTAGCQLQKCTGQCICTDDPTLLCSSSVDIGLGKEYSCAEGKCVARGKPGVCGNGLCEPASGENFLTCPVTKGGDCPYVPSCGNGICDQIETCRSCASDCGSCLAMGFLEQTGLQPYNLTSRSILADTGTYLFTSDSNTMYQYYSPSDLNDYNYPLEDKLQNYCVTETGNVCQRIDTFATITNRLNEPILNLNFNFTCKDYDTETIVLDSDDGYETGYLRDWNVLNVPRSDRVWFIPEDDIDLDEDNIQARVHFYIPSDISIDSNNLQIILNTGTAIGTKIVYLAPLESAGIQVNLMTMALPTENLLYECTLDLNGQLPDGNTVSKSVTALFESKHPNVVCREGVTIASCKRYRFEGGRCILETISNCCGNGVCETGNNETYGTCPTDCSYKATCGNGTCDTTENWWTCSDDCGTALRLGIFESDNDTIFSGNDGFQANPDYNSTDTSTTLGGELYKIIQSNSQSLETGGIELCSETSTHRCQRVDTIVELRNDTNGVMDKVTFSFTCTEPDTGTTILAKKTSGSAKAKFHTTADWNIAISGTNLWRVPVKTASDGEQLQAKAYFEVPTDMIGNIPASILLDSGGTTGTEVVILENEKIVQFKMGFLAKFYKNTTFLWKCTVTFAMKSGSNSQSNTYNLLFKTTNS